MDASNYSSVNRQLKNIIETVFDRIGIVQAQVQAMEK